MAEKTLALIKPDLLVWARNTAGFSVEVAAEKAHVKPDKLQAWEAGSEFPTIPQLRRLAQTYKRPLAVFYLPSPPRLFDAMRDFRRLPGGKVPKPSPQLLYEIRQAHQRRDIALELLKAVDEAPRPFELSADLQSDPVKVGSNIRSQLGITLERQFSWRDERLVLRKWKDIIEAKGVLVFQSQGIPVDDMRGFSISDSHLPVITLNGKDSPKGRLFTLLHEFTHLLVRAGGICDLRERGANNSPDRRIETFCNRVAGEILVPRFALQSQDVVIHREKNAEWTDEEIAVLADRFSVSREVLLRALVLARLASKDFYGRKRAMFLASYKKARRATGPIPVYVRVLAKNGTRYSETVLGAYRENAIDASDLSDYMGVGLRHISDIENALFARRDAGV
jgi:Zn-dependent peptidase ImmA (M78 family)